MTDEAPRERLTARQTLFFYAKLLGLLAAIGAFGLAAFYLRRAL